MLDGGEEPLIFSYLPCATVSPDDSVQKSQAWRIKPQERTPHKIKPTNLLWLILTDAVRESRRPHGGARLAAVAGDGGAALQDESGVAAVLNRRPHQEFRIRQGPGGVLHVAGIWAVHDWGNSDREEDKVSKMKPNLPYKCLKSC